MSGTQPPERIAPASARVVGHLQRRVVIALGTMFVVAMALAGPFADWPIDARAAVPRLMLVAVSLPLLMALLARRILEPLRELEFAQVELNDLYQRARLDSLLDPVTGLGNYRAFQEEIARQVEEARRYGGPLSLILLDLDDLKRVNDADGHAAGDGVLAALGGIITASSRRSDRGFRIGGDEFAILLPHTKVEDAAVLARRLLATALDGSPAGKAGFAFSFSAGVSAYPRPSTDGPQLYRQADAAMYWCKHHGRTDIQVFDPARHGAAGDDRSQPELAAAVSAVATTHSLTPVYQPIFSLATGQPVGFEGLVRPIQGSGFRDPGSLFAAAEATGRTVELDMACLEVVAAGVGTLAPGRYLAVNISPRTLETHQFSAAELIAIFARHGIAPTSVVLELTERERVEDLDTLQANLASCRSAGMRLAADDIGAGNAGLRLLSEIRFDVVKIDLSLVQGGALRESSLAVLGALRELTDRWQAVTVAEGVETGHQLEVIRELGLSAAQGYLLGRPQPAARANPIDLDHLVETERLRQQGFLATIRPPQPFGRPPQPAGRSPQAAGLGG